MASSNPHYEADPKAIVLVVKGREMIKVEPRGLNIVWGRDERYWVLSEGVKPAELLQVCWLEVTGCVCIEPRKDYEVTFELSFTPDAFGWRGLPIYIIVKKGKYGKSAWKKFLFTTDSGTRVFCVTGKSKKTDRENQWLMDSEKLYFGLYEVWSGKWKGGLKIHSVKVKEVYTD